MSKNFANFGQILYMKLSTAEENYLKSIFYITELNKQPASTNAIAKDLNTKASSVSDMLKKLSDKELIKYKKYKPVKLEKQGKIIAINLIRSHRIWETFLVERLGFNWSAVHNIAEQLEHIENVELTDKLSTYLDNPLFDPHGEPIPDKNGKFPTQKQIVLSSLKVGQEGRLCSVEEDDRSFLETLNNLNIKIGTPLKLEKIISFDNSFQVLINNRDSQLISDKIANNLFVTKSKK